MKPADEPWTKQHYFAGQGVYIVDAFERDKKIIGEGEVIRTRRNKYGRISYIVQHPDGSKKEYGFEELRITPEGIEAEQVNLKRLETYYECLKKSLLLLDDKKRGELFSGLEQLCEGIKED